MPGLVAKTGGLDFVLISVGTYGRVLSKHGRDWVTLGNPWLWGKDGLKSASVVQLCVCVCVCVCE